MNWNAVRGEGTEAKGVSPETRSQRKEIRVQSKIKEDCVTPLFLKLPTPQRQRNGRERQKRKKYIKEIKLDMED